MKKPNEFYVNDIKVIRPSSIVNVDGEFIKDKNGVEYVSQEATFKQSTQLVIAYFNNKAYTDIVNLGKGDNYYTARARSLEKNRYPVNYYNSAFLNKHGITLDNKIQKFYNLFENDFISLTDYLYVKENKLNPNNLITRLKYYKKPFNFKNLELKDNYHKQDKPFYSLEELEKIYKELKKLEFPEQAVTKKYCVVRVPVSCALISGSFFRTTPEYAGTTDDLVYTHIKIKNKILGI